jgi:hypothetical protein
VLVGRGDVGRASNPQFVGSEVPIHPRRYGQGGEEEDLS